MKIFKRLQKKISGQRSREPKECENPSVMDFSSVKELKDALLGKKKKNKKKRLGRAAAVNTEDDSTTRGSSPTETTVEDSVLVDRVPDEDAAAWKLSNLDVANSEPQSMEAEVQRLTALQSYFILDADTSAEFDRITDMAARVFDVPVACVTMIDLGRLWFLTATGIPGANGVEAPRKVAICAHVVKSNLPCLVVPDASQDERFSDSPLVSDPNGPSIRFYAGCPLIVPEGAKLGTFCIIDQKPRHKPFTENDQRVLQDMAALAVNALVARRNRLLKQEQDSKMLELAESYAEMHSCLCKASSCVAKTSVASKSRRSSAGLLSLSGNSTVADALELEADDEEEGSILSYEQLADELQLHTDLSAANARTIVLDSQQFQFDNLEAIGEDEQELARAKKKVPPAYVRLLQSNGNDNDNFSVGSRSLRRGSNGQKGPPPLSNGGASAVNVLDLYQNLNDICSRFTRPVPIHVELHGSVPLQLRCRGSDLLVFQATMSLLANANARVHTCADDDDGMIHLCLKTIHAGTHVLVECQDTGCFAAEWEGSMEFSNPRSLLYPVRKISRSLGGECGMRLGCFDEERGYIDEKAGGLRASAVAAGVQLLDDVEHEQQYCIFWWSMPLVMLKDNSTNANDKLDDSLDDSEDLSSEEEEDRETLLKTHEATVNGRH